MSAINLFNNKLIEAQSGPILEPIVFSARLT